MFGWQAQEILLVLLEHGQQTLVVADVGGCAMHEVHIAQDVHQQMTLDAVGCLIPTVAFGVDVSRVRVLSAHRVADQ